MARQILDVFLSSTALDLEPHRKAIQAELISTGLFHCVRQEDFGAQNAGAVEFCRDKVKASDIFIGLTGQRRGWEPDVDDARRSITEMEHDWAKEAGRRRYLYVAPDDFPLPNNLRDTDELHVRQQAFRKRVMDGGERVVSQKGFENPERFAADVVKHLLTQLVTGDLITLLRPDLSALSPVSPEEQRPAIAAAVERLADDEDLDLLALATDPKNVDLIDIEARLRARAEAQETEGRAALKIGAEYWRHIGALAFLHNTQKALAAYEKAVALDSLNPEGWGYLGELHYRLGDPVRAEQSFERVLALGRVDDDLKTQAMGCVRLGWIASQSGDLIKAEELTIDAVRFAEAAEWQEGLARAYGNLGIIHQTRGNLSKAEEMQKKALTLEEALDNRVGMARAYGNLGNTYHMRGNLDKAEDMHLKSIKLEEELGNKEGVAADYNNLGVIYQHRGNLEKAEEMHRKALALIEELGSKEGLARTHVNLGSLYRTRGDLAQAEEMNRKGLKLYGELGSKEGLAAAYVNIGAIHQTRGNSHEAEEMYRKGLTLQQDLGNKEGMAVTNRNLASLYQQANDDGRMCDCLRTARDLYREMGLPDSVAEMETWLKQNKCSDS